MKMWFYVKSSAALRMLDDGSVEQIFPYASKMKEMKPIYKVEPLIEMSEERKACDKAFVLACHYFRGCDLVEEMVASNFWPLGRKNEEFTIEMVQDPVFGPPEGIPFPRFGRALPEGETKESFLERVEAYARSIMGKISKREFVQRQSVLGTIPWFNRVFEELGIKHEEYVIPSDVILSLEKKKDAGKNLTAAAESKKRRGGGASKALAEKQRAGIAAEAPIESSSDCSSTTESNLVRSPAEEVQAAPVTAILGGRKVGASRGVSSTQEPSRRLPMPLLLGEDSSDAEAPATDPPREAPAGGASPPKEV